MTLKMLNNFKVQERPIWKDARPTGARFWRPLAVPDIELGSMLDDGKSSSPWADNQGHWGK